MRCSNETESLVCEEVLDNVDDITKKVYAERRILRKCIVDAENTLKPKHLLFDGLDEEYDLCESMDNTNLDEDMDIESDNDVGPNDWDMNMVLNDPNIVSVSVKRKRIKYREVEYPTYPRYNDHDLDVYCTDCKELILHTLRGHLYCGECISYSVDEYCNNRQDDIDHNWSAPARDEMDDLQESIDTSEWSPDDIHC